MDPVRRRLPRAERHQQLLDAAEEVFAASGVHAASMDEIAERAGITKPIVYDHFGSKDGLLAAVISRAGAQLQAATAAAVESARDPEDALARGLYAYFTFIAHRSAGWRALLTVAGGADAAATRTLEDVRGRQAEYIAGLIVAQTPGIGLSRARTYAQIVVGAAERLTGRDADGHDAAELTAHMMDVVWLGFRALHGGERWERDSAAAATEKAPSRSARGPRPV